MFPAPLPTVTLLIVKLCVLSIAILSPIVDAEVNFGIVFVVPEKVGLTPLVPLLPPPTINNAENHVPCPAELPCNNV